MMWEVWSLEKWTFIILDYDNKFSKLNKYNIACAININVKYCNYFYNGTVFKKNYRKYY